MIKLCRSTALVLSGFALLAAWGAGARAEDKTFMLIPALPGESTADAAHANWIDAYALDSVAQDSGPSVATFNVSILKGTDKASPGLNDAIARGLTFPLVTIDVCRALAPLQCYYKLELTNAVVTKIDLSGSSCVGTGACTPSQTESISFLFTKIKWIYTPWTGGSPGTPVTKCWDLQLNVAC